MVRYLGLEGMHQVEKLFLLCGEEAVEAAGRASRLRQFVLDNYDVQRNAEHLLSTYESLIAARQGLSSRSLQQSPRSLSSSITCAHSC